MPYLPSAAQPRRLGSLSGFFASPECVGFLCPRVHAQAGGTACGCTDASTLERFMVLNCLCKGRDTASEVCI